MEIIKAEIIDAKRLTNLCIRSKMHWEYTEQQIEHWLSDLTITHEYLLNNKVYKLIDENKTLIGFYSFLHENTLEIVLDFFFIDPIFIGKGFGKILLKNAIEKAKSMESNKILLESDPNAQKFYEKFGFKIIDKKESSIEGRFLPIMKYELK